MITDNKDKTFTVELPSNLYLSTVFICTGKRKLVERKKGERKLAADNWSLRKLDATKISHYEN